jgi:phage repressor protein C with HTH and peptisase S24 domain
MRRKLNELESTWADNLKKIWNSKKKSLGLTQEKAGYALNMTQAGVSHYLNKTAVLGIETKLKWAELLEVPVTDIDPDFKWASLNSINESTPRPKSELFSISTWDSQTPLANDEVEVPLFREVALSAGIGMTEVIENHGPKLRFSKSSLRNANVEPHNAACCFANGDSMGKVVPDGASIGIDKGVTQIIDGEIYAIDHGGMLKIKYLYRLPKGGIRIRSELTEEYPDEDLTAEEAQLDLRIIGFVFWISAIRTAKKPK